MPLPHSRIRTPQPVVPPYQTPDSSLNTRPCRCHRASCTATKADQSSFQPTEGSDPYMRLQEGQYETSVPTVADRVAQTVVRMYLEPKVEPIFHPDSYGYRPGKSAVDPGGTRREGGR